MNLQHQFNTFKNAVSYLIIALFLLTPEPTDAADNQLNTNIDLLGLNSYFTERTPNNEKQVEITGSNVHIPPTSKRQGLFLRAGIKSIYNDNLFFDSVDTEHDLKSVFLLGIHYKRHWSKFHLVLDFENNSTQYNDNSHLNDNSESQSFLLRADYQFNTTTQLHLNFLGHNFKDPSNTIIIGKTNKQMEQVQQDNVLLQLSHNINNNLNFSASTANYTSDYDSASSVDSNSLDYQLGSYYMLDNTKQIGIVYRTRKFDFDNSSKIDSQAYYLNYKHKFSKIYKLQAKLGRYKTLDAPRHVNNLASIAVTMSRKYLNLTVQADQDLMTAGIGDNTLFKTHNYSLSSRKRLGKAFYGFLAYDNNKYISLTNNSNYFHLTSFKTGLTYVYKSKIFFRGEYMIIDETDQPGSVEKQANKVLFSIRGYF